jgi:hypothetical protein
MLRNRRISLAWNAYLAELAAMQMAEDPSGAMVPKRLREYLCNRLTEATRVRREERVSL